MNETSFALETELKLELSLKSADALEKSGLLARAPRIARQHTIYFDTPARRLAKAGVTLRIRRIGDRRVQTVKTRGSRTGGLAVRPEWAAELESDEPVLTAAPFGTHAADTPTGDIAPIFHLDVERRSWSVVRGDSIIELVIDRGLVTAGGRSAPLCEVELELNAGHPSALFGLAREIDAISPVRLGVLSKSDRGFRLLSEVCGPARSEPIELPRQASAAEALQTIISACLCQFRLNEAIVLERDDAAALHQLRVSLRRLRAAFTIFKSLLTDATSQDLKAATKTLTAHIAPARDLDVLIERTRSGELQRRLVQARAAAYADARAVLKNSWARGLLLNLAEWTSLGEWRQLGETRKLRELPARAFAGAALTKLRKALKTDGVELDALDDAARHAVRINAKTLRYAAEFFAPLFCDKDERKRQILFLASLERLQDELGALNDLAAGPKVLDRLGMAGASGADVLIGATPTRKQLCAAARAHRVVLEADRYWR